jgi:hypothetical protein
VTETNAEDRCFSDIANAVTRIIYGNKYTPVEQRLVASALRDYGVTESICNYTDAKVKAARDRAANPPTVHKLQDMLTGAGGEG